MVVLPPNETLQFDPQSTLSCSEGHPIKSLGVVGIPRMSMSGLPRPKHILLEREDAKDSHFIYPQLQGMYNVNISFASKNVPSRQWEPLHNTINCHLLSLNKAA